MTYITIKSIQLAAALFANSPFKEGVPSSYLTTRGFVIVMSYCSPQHLNICFLHSTDIKLCWLCCKQPHWWVWQTSHWHTPLCFLWQFWVCLPFSNFTFILWHLMIWSPIFFWSVTLVGLSSTLITLLMCRWCLFIEKTSTLTVVICHSGLSSLKSHYPSIYV